MKVKELIKALGKLHPEGEVHLVIANPKDSASSNEVDVRPVADGVQLYGWVSSDNPRAFAPWAREDE